MTTPLFTGARLATFARIALSLSLALLVPHMIMAVAPPAPGTEQGFLVWF